MDIKIPIMKDLDEVFIHFGVFEKELVVLLQPFVLKGKGRVEVGSAEIK